MLQTGGALQIYTRGTTSRVYPPDYCIYARDHGPDTASSPFTLQGSQRGDKVPGMASSGGSLSPNLFSLLWEIHA